MYFKTASKEQILEAQRKATEKQRSPELKKAWADSQKIWDLYVSGVEVNQIKDQYKIGQRACYRILKQFRSDDGRYKPTD